MDPLFCAEGRNGLQHVTDHGSGGAVPGVNDLFLDEPLAIHLDAGIDITAHGADESPVALGVPLDGDPVRGDAVASPIGLLDKQVLRVMLPTAPVGTPEEMAGKSPDAPRRSVPSFPVTSLTTPSGVNVATTPAISPVSMLHT